MSEGTEVIDGGVYRKLTPEEYKIKTTWFNSPTTKKGVRRDKKKIIEKDGENFFPVTATTVSTELGMSSTNAAKVYNEMIQNIKDVEFIKEFGTPDEKVELGEDRIQVTFEGGKSQTYTKTHLLHKLYTT